MDGRERERREKVGEGRRSAGGKGEYASLALGGMEATERC